MNAGARLHQEKVNDYLPRFNISERSQLLNADMTDPGAPSPQYPVCKGRKTSHYIYV